MQPKPISDFSNGDLVFLRENMDAGEVRETFYCLQLGADTKYEGNLPVMALGCALGDYEYADSPPRYRAFRASPIPERGFEKLPVLPLSEKQMNWKYCHHMTEEEANLSAVRFANDILQGNACRHHRGMRKGGRRKSRSSVVRMKHRKAFSPASATPVANAYWCEEIAEAIRSLHHSHPGLEREE